MNKRFQTGPYVLGDGYIVVNVYDRDGQRVAHSERAPYDYEVSELMFKALVHRTTTRATAVEARLNEGRT